MALAACERARINILAGSVAWAGRCFQPTTINDRDFTARIGDEISGLQRSRSVCHANATYTEHLREELVCQV